MKKNVIFLSLCYVMFNSCMAESNNLSPLTSNLSDERLVNYNIIENTNSKLKKNVYASEISKITTSFPNTSSTKLNEKVSLLKYEIQYYLEVNSNPNLELSARKKIVSTYKKIQSLIKDLPEEEREIVKIHLVKIKTNLTKLKPNNPSS